LRNCSWSRSSSRCSLPQTGPPNKALHLGVAPDRAGIAFYRNTPYLAAGPASERSRSRTLFDFFLSAFPLPRSSEPSCFLVSARPLRRNSTWPPSCTALAVPEVPCPSPAACPWPA
jgi:hypothetical protein